MSLITQADLEARLGRPLTAEEVSSFTIINAANQAYVENLIGSSVEAANITTRYYDGGRQFTPIDPCSDVSAVEVVDEYENVVETIDSSDYVLESRNKTIKTQLTYRYGKISRGINNIAITGKFSIFADSAIVAIVKDALLSALESEVDNSDNIVKESIEGYSVEFAKTATKNSLDKLSLLFPRIT